jgi:peptidoglycan/xylan/chitin deacetylase (PgdA/CDA1 family)
MEASQTQAAEPLIGDGKRSFTNRAADVIPSRVWMRLVAARFESAGCPYCVVAFHRVSNVVRDELTFPPDRFEALCRHWKNHYEIISLDQLHLRLAAGICTRRPTIAITFDDGYADNLELAAPILKRLNLPATFFVTTSYISTRRYFSWDRANSQAARMMTWEQVQSLEHAGFAIGSHTANHVRVAETSAEELWSELQQSRQALAERLNQVSPDFAYPFGGEFDCRDTDREIIRAAGYRTCFSCCGGLVRSSDDTYHLRRVAVSPAYHLTPTAWERAFARLLSASPIAYSQSAAA